MEIIQLLYITLVMRFVFTNDFFDCISIVLITSKLKYTNQVVVCCSGTIVLLPHLQCFSPMEILLATSYHIQCNFIMHYDYNESGVSMIKTYA